MNKHSGSKLPFSYAWVILVVLAIGNLVSFGVRVSFGAYMSPWEQEFSVGRTIVSSISMLSFVVFALGQPVAGKLNDRYGKGIICTSCIFLMGASLYLISHATQIWQIFILYGLTFSIGVAGVTSSIVAAIMTKWFEKKKGLAIGIASSGMAVGQLILVPINLFAIERLGWRPAIMTLGIVVFLVVGPLYLFLLRSKPEEKGLKPYGYEESSNEIQNSVNSRSDDALRLLDLFKVRVFWFLLIPYFVCGFTDVGLIGTHFIPIANWKGFQIEEVAIAIGLSAIFNIIGTITIGHLSDLFSRKRQLAAIYAIRATTYVLLILLGQTWLLMCFTILFGTIDMATITPANSLAAQLFDGRSTGLVLGIVSLAHQLGGAAGAWIPGLIYDLTNSYTPSLMLAILLLVVAAALSLRFPEFDKNS